MLPQSTHFQYTSLLTLPLPVFVKLIHYFVPTIYADDRIVIRHDLNAPDPITMLVTVTWYGITHDEIALAVRLPTLAAR